MSVQLKKWCFPDKLYIITDVNAFGHVHEYLGPPTMGWFYVAVRFRSVRRSNFASCRNRLGLTLDIWDKENIVWDMQLLNFPWPNVMAVELIKNCLFVR